jgi:hypothetical protein
MTPPSALRTSVWLVRASQPRLRRSLNIGPKHIYKWQEEGLTLVAARGEELDPATAAELRQLLA